MELHERSGVELAAMIREREVSSREVLDHLVERVARLDGPVNAVVTLDVERAREEAGAADRAVVAGEPLGPLHGVPMTLKDSWQTAGLRTTSGAPELAGFVPTEDAWPVARLRAAGAVVFAKTNLPTYAGDHQSYNEVFGATNNPFDPDRTCGGSSGGSAAALAARFTPIELGSDIGGSIRGPAHCCGVVGHKPSYGIVPFHGHIPGPPGSLGVSDIAVAGPMARTVEDCDLLLGLLAGPDRWDGPAWRLDLPPSRAAAREPLRVAAWLDDPACPVDPEVRALLEGAAAALAMSGAEVNPDARPAVSFAEAVDTYETLLAGALATSYSAEAIERWGSIASPADRAGETDGPVDEVARTKRRTAQRHREWLLANERRLRHRQAWADLFESWHVALLPVQPVPAVAHDHSTPMAARTIATADGGRRPYLDLTRWVGIVGSAYLPSTVVPVGLTSGGLPVGIQVVAPYLHDRTALDVAARLQALLGPCPTPPLG